MNIKGKVNYLLRYDRIILLIICFALTISLVIKINNQYLIIDKISNKITSNTLLDQDNNKLSIDSILKKDKYTIIAFLYEPC